MVQKPVRSSRYTQSHTVNLWQKDIEARFTCLFCHSLSKPCCPFPVLVALEDCVPRGEIHRGQEPGLMWQAAWALWLGCTGMFVFLVHNWIKVPLKALLLLEYHRVSWRGTAGQGNMIFEGQRPLQDGLPILGICIGNSCHKPETWGVLWALSSTLALSDSGEGQNVSWKENPPSGFLQAHDVTQLVSCALAFLSVVYFPRYFAQTGSL